MRAFDVTEEGFDRFEDILTLETLDDLQTMLKRVVLEIHRRRVERTFALFAPDRFLDQGEFIEHELVGLLLRFEWQRRGHGQQRRCVRAFR